LRLKCSLCIETEPEIWEPLKEVGLLPGISLYFSRVKVRKTQPIEGFDIACKWKRKYRGVSVKEGWFILTNLGSLKKAIAAYQKRMGIEEMFRDYKSGGYYLEGTGLKGQRLMGLKQKSSPNKAQTLFVSSKPVPILMEPQDKSIRYGCLKGRQSFCKSV